MAVPPSATVTVVGLTVTPATSLSVMETTVSLMVPAVTPVGRAPKVNFTRSPSSSMVSSVAVKVKVFEVSPDSKVTELGTLE